MKLPSHIVIKNNNWFFNEKTQRYIHKDKIENFLEKYWSFRKNLSESYVSKVNYKKNIKSANRRWNNEK